MGVLGCLLFFFLFDCSNSGLAFLDFGKDEVALGSIDRAFCSRWLCCASWSLASGLYEVFCIDDGDERMHVELHRGKCLGIGG